MHATLVVDLVRARMHRVLLLASGIFCCCLIGLRDPALRESFFPGGCVWARWAGCPRRLLTKKLTKSMSHQRAPGAPRGYITGCPLFALCRLFKSLEFESLQHRTFPRELSWRVVTRRD